MKRLTQKQKKEIQGHARFWAIHASHWLVSAVFIMITFSLLYTFWGSDQAFATVVIGSN